MKRKTIIYICLSAVLLAYLFVAVSMTRDVAGRTPFTDVIINVNDTARTGFVTANDIDRALGGLRGKFAQIPRSRVNTRDLESRLRTLDKIEDARVLMLNNGTLRIDVDPMRPVARIFDRNANYYINSAGKRLPADALHRVDVPVVSGHFADPSEVTALLPMFDIIRNNPEYDALVTAVTVNRRGDIIMIPAVAGHVINFGDTSLVDDKFKRLRRFYHDVMPIKGWEYYDTLSVKWRGRLVATKRKKKVVTNIPLTELDGLIDEVLDDETMISDVNITDSLLKL